MDGNTTHLEPSNPASLSTGARISADRETKSFAFDRSYWSAGSRDDPQYASQETLFRDLGVDLLNHAFEGFNTTILAYGQTSSGKTYSMMGYGDDRGIIPRVCAAMFERIERSQSDTLSFNVEVSYLEIYQERVRDLLDPKNKANLKVREHPSLGPYVEDLCKLAVTSFADIECLMDEGNKARTVGSTQMNETSSRSHALFTVTLTQRRLEETVGMAGEKVSRISLVDLAGSERANATGATGTRLKEGAQINKSLTTLGKVIAALAQANTAKGGKKADFVPYRDSILTWLLKDSLGGNSKTAMIAAISPADYEETLSTLRYAWQAKQIRNKPTINEDPNAKLIRELKEELATLRMRMSAAGKDMMHDSSVPPEQQMVQYRTKNGEMRTVSKAELQDQLEASEKLMAEVNQTWEEKLHKTHEANAAREAALEALGIIVEKNLVGVQTPKNIPHLVNLAEDPLASGALLYILKPGRTMIGNTESTEAVDIRLGGDSVLQQHCVFEVREDGSVYLTALPDSTTIVNGQRIEGNKPRPMKSGYRIFIGSHAFRLSHPEEVRRTRQKSAELAATDPFRSPMHHLNGTDSPANRSDSPAPPGMDGDEIDWSFARREAVMGRVTGQDIDLDKLEDDDLDHLFAEVTRARESRRAGTASLISGRESQIDSSTEGDGDAEVFSDFMHNRQSSNSTWMDDASAENALKSDAPDDMPDALRQVKEELEEQMESQRLEYEERLRAMQRTSAEAEEIRHERLQMEQKMQLVQDEMQHMLDEQRQHYETKVSQLTRKARHSSVKAEEWQPLSEKELLVAREVVNRWKRLTRVKMAESALIHAVHVKEANAIARELGKTVTYQLAVIDGPPLQSPAQSGAESIAGAADVDEAADVDLAQRQKPCIACMVFDHEQQAIYYWSLEKLSLRLVAMRGLLGYVDKPMSAQHLSWDGPFVDAPAPSYTHLGTALVSLMPLSRSLEATCEVSVFSRLTSEIVARCRVRIQPSAVVPSSSMTDAAGNMLEIGSRMSFEVTVDRIRGLASEEMSSIHCQIRTSSFAGETGEPDDVLTSSHFNVDTQGTTSLRLHRTLSVTISPVVQHHLAACLAPIDFFIRAEPIHLKRLEQWNLLRESKARQEGALEGGAAGRRNELEFVQEQRHDVFLAVELCELAATGKYEPVPLVVNSALDPGAFFLRQGLQRRLHLRMSHTSGRTWSWSQISNVRLGDVRHIDDRGLVHGSASHAPTLLRPTGKALPVFESDGTASIDFTAAWDSSTHESPFLDRTTAPRCRTLLRLTWTVDLPGSIDVPFELDIGITVHPRDAGRPGGRLGNLFASSKVLERATALFAVCVSPTGAKKSSDLWRRDTSKIRIRGEETLGKTWLPRGVSLVIDHDHLTARERRLARVAGVRCMLATIPVARLISASAGEDEEEKLQSAVDLWQRRFGPREQIKLVQEPTPSMTRRSRESSGERFVTATAQLIPRSIPVARRSYVKIMRDPSSEEWIRLFAVLRRPYLHLYEASDEMNEVSVINTSSVRVEISTELTEMLGKPNVFAIYTARTSLFVQADSAANRTLWLKALDTSLL